MLIDMDLAEELDKARSGARRGTSTTEFMAILVLSNKDHTYRHDIESFFYVLLWQCAAGTGSLSAIQKAKGQPTPSHITMWYTGTFEQIALVKADLVEIPYMFDLIKGFPRSWKI